MFVRLTIITFASEEKSGLMTKFFVGFADMEKSAYHFYLEFADQSTTQEQAFEKFKAQCIAEGARDGQFKMNLLMQDEKRHAKFKQLVIE